MSVGGMCCACEVGKAHGRYTRAKCCGLLTHEPRVGGSWPVTPTHRQRHTHTNTLICAQRARTRTHTQTNKHTQDFLHQLVQPDVFRLELSGTQQPQLHTQGETQTERGSAEAHTHGQGACHSGGNAPNKTHTGMFVFPSCSANVASFLSRATVYTLRRSCSHRIAPQSLTIATPIHKHTHPARTATRGYKLMHTSTH